MNVIWTYKLVKEFIESLGYELISTEYKNTSTKLVYKDRDGYYYSQIFNDLRRNKKSHKFYKSNPYTIQNIKLWCKLNNKLFELISDTYEGNDVKLKWKCLKEECGEIFEMNWDCIYRGSGCSFCAGKQVGLSNCLATKRPDLIDEWHSTKNGNLTPYDVVCGSHKNIWWQCSKNPKHEWDASISDRTYMNSGCPYCAGVLPSEDYNLLVINPKLCEEWNYNKNDKLPSEYTPNSGIEVWWKCKKCGHEWSMNIQDRNQGKCRCPKCSDSYSESTTFYLLKKFSINFEQEYIFKDCKYISELRYDFYLNLYNTAIELQGQHHYNPVTYGGMSKEKAQENFIKQKIKDQIKRDYCKNNNIKLIEIPYWEFDNIEQILIKELNLLSKVS